MIWSTTVEKQIEVSRFGQFSVRFIILSGVRHGIQKVKPKMAKTEGSLYHLND